MLNYRRFFDVDGADRRPRRGARRVRRHPPGAARPQPPRRRSRASGSTTRTGWPTPRATSTGCAEATAGPARDLGREDPRGRRAAARLWACDGTTGYDALQAVADRAGRPRRRAASSTDAWAEAGGEPDAASASVDDVQARGRRPSRSVPERRRLTRRAREALPDAGPRAAARGRRRAARGRRGLPRLRPARRAARRRAARERLEDAPRPGRGRPARPRARARAA